MPNPFKPQEWISSWGDRLSQQAWVQQLKVRWEELEPTKKAYSKLGLWIAGCFLILWILFGSLWHVHRLKQEWAQQKELLTFVQTTQLKIEQLNRERVIPSPLSLGAGSSKDVSWTSYLENIALGLGLSKEQFNLNSETPGDALDEIQENLLEVALNRVNIKQIIRYIVSVETHQRPAQLKKMSLSTQFSADGYPNGYIDATLWFSGYTEREQP